MWSRSDPGAGEPAGIRFEARRRRNAADALRSESRARLQAAIATASSASWTAKSATTFVATAQSLQREVELMIAGLDNDALAFGQYASRVDQIKDAATGLRAQERSLSDDIARYTRMLAAPDYVGAPTGTLALKLQHELVQAQARLRALQPQWDDLQTRRRQADAACVASLTSVASRGNLAPLTAGRVSSATLLKSLAGLSAIELAALFATNPGLARELKDPYEISSWWKGLDDSARKHLINAIPGVIGNLEGVNYTDRNTANQKALKRYDALLKSIASSPNQTEELKQHGFTLASFAEAQALVKSMHAALAGATKDTPREIMSLTLGVHPTAAIAMGDLDTASRITFVVPGMGTTIAGSMKGWATSSYDLLVAQRDVANREGMPTNLSTIGWIGYRTPDLPPGSFEVLAGGMAQEGGDKLAAAMNGVIASKGWGFEDSRLAIAAHSYGTTTAADALTQSSAGSFTMFGSAGIDDSITSAADLNVPSGEVFATHAEADHVAPLGQIFRIDPLSATFGSRDFSSETTLDPVDDELFNGVTGHPAQIHSNTDSGFGYLDPTTESLHNIARTTMGFGTTLQIHTEPRSPNFTAGLGVEG